MGVVGRDQPPIQRKDRPFYLKDETAVKQLMGLALTSGRITNDDYELFYAHLLELRVEKGIGVLRMHT